MSKILKTVGMIAGAIALVATGVGAFAGAAFAASAAGATVASIATYAGLAAGVANIGAAALQKPPPARGNVTQVLIAPDAPQPYVMGEGYFAGVQRHDAAYGATLNKVPNPYRAFVIVYSGGGPVESITPWVEKAAVSSWYTGYLYTSTALGLCPEPAALVPYFAGLPGWDSTSKLSGQAAILWNLKFDKDGKRFAAGVPQFGAWGRWVKVYDPRLDSTFPGGSGSHRLGVESTYTWSENPALHAGTYAFGRYQNGKRTFGMGLSADGIDWSCIAAWANVCDANAWKIFGVVYEPGNRWANLKDIAAAGGGRPLPSSGGRLSFQFSAPKIPLDTITAADLAEDVVRITAMPSWGDGINTLIPKYISADHDWQQVAADPVSVSTFVAEDGEEKVREWPLNCVRHAKQAAELCAYQVWDGRELTPIVLNCLPRLRHYRPGECLEIDLPEYGLTLDAVIINRAFDPARMTVTLTLMSETYAKHAWALGRSAAPPPTPALGQTQQQRDELAAAAALPSGYFRSLIASSWQGAVTITATDDEIVIGNHDRIYSDLTVAVTGATLAVDDTAAAIAAETVYYLYYDDATRAGGAVTWAATTDFYAAQLSDTAPDRHFGGWIITDAIGGTGTSGGGATPPGSGIIEPTP